MFLFFVVVKLYVVYCLDFIYDYLNLIIEYKLIKWVWIWGYLNIW